MFLINLLLSMVLTAMHARVSAAVECPQSWVPVTGTATFTVNLPQPGNYKVWVSVMGQGPSANSVYLQFDDLYCADVGDSSDMPVGSFVWVDYTGGNVGEKIPSPIIAAGAHTIKLMGNGNEPGVAVDRIILTLDTSCSPTGNGDACIGIVSTPTPTPIPTPTLTPTPTPKSGRKSTPTPTLAAASQLTSSLTIQTTSLPQATAGQSYTAPVDATSSVVGDTLTISATGLPAGLAIGSCNNNGSFGGTTVSCTISGTPSAKGNYLPVFTVTNTTGQSASKSLRLQVR